MNALAWAKRLVANIDPRLRALLARDARRAIENEYLLTVIPTVTPPRQRGHGGLCDGMSILEERKILYVPTPRSRREHFTLLHELAHFLIRENAELLIWLADRDDPSRAVEEICDRVAAELLVPKQLLDEVIGGAKPGAGHVVTLFKRSNASREVCVIATAQRLGCEGFVALVDRARWAVSFAARLADTRPYPWRDDPVPSAHPLRRIGVNKKSRGLAWWPHANGDQREYYFDALSDDCYVYAVFADRDLWGMATLHILEEAPTPRGRGYSADVRCPSCGFQGVTHKFPCPECRQPYCPRCGKCECQRRLEQSGVCTVCHCRVPNLRLRNGVCNDCKLR